MTNWTRRSAASVALVVAVSSLAGPAAWSHGRTAAPSRADARTFVGDAAKTSPHARTAAGSAVFTDRKVARALGNAKDDVAFSVRDRRTGQTYTYNGRLENTTASIVKVLVLTTVVRERRRGGRSLTERQKSLAARMIRHSDNDATTSLFRQVGGRTVVQRMARDLGMTHTTVKSAWGTTTTTAADQRLLMDRLVDGTRHLSRQDRDYILGLMRSVTPEQRWGVGVVPAGTTVAVKNGWVPIAPRGWRVNSIGAVSGGGRDYTLSILSYDNSSMETGVERARIVSELVWNTLGSAAAAAPVASGAGGAQSAPYWVKPGGALPPPPFA